MENAFNEFLPFTAEKNWDPIFVIGKFADPVTYPSEYDPYAMDPLPPIYLPPAPDPIKDYAAPPVDNGGIIYRTYLYSGYVRDAVSELPLAGATVVLYANGNVMAQVVTDSKGSFTISTATPAESITVSEAEHKTYNWPASEVQHLFDLERKNIELPPVILPPVASKSNKAIIWIIAAAIIAKSQKWI